MKGLLFLDQKNSEFLSLHTPSRNHYQILDSCTTLLTSVWSQSGGLEWIGMVVHQSFHPALELAEWVHDCPGLRGTPRNSPCQTQPMKQWKGSQHINPLFLELSFKVFLASGPCIQHVSQVAKTCFIMWSTSLHRMVNPDSLWSIGRPKRFGCVFQSTGARGNHVGLKPKHWGIRAQILKIVHTTSMRP